MKNGSLAIVVILCLSATSNSEGFARRPLEKTARYELSIMPAAMSSGIGSDFLGRSIFGGSGASFLFEGAARDQKPRELSVGRFLQPYPFAAGVEPQFVVQGDFNGDGKPDLAVVNYCQNPSNCVISSTGSVSILLNNGNGKFQAHVDYPVESSPVAIAVGDFNGDGKLDLAVANFCGTVQNPTDCEYHNAGGTVSILLGNGDGTFQPQVVYATNDYPNWIAVGDFNGDGKPDLVTSNGYFGEGSTVSVLLNQGNGKFGQYTDYGTASGSSSVAVADFNNDGKLDIVTTDQVVGKVSILLGNGNGTFQGHVDYPSDASGAIVVADFNGDGNEDIANTSDGFVNVLLGNGDGSFQPLVMYPAVLGAKALAAADVNHDGIPDLVATNEAANTISVFLGNGNGTFGAHVEYGTGSFPTSGVAGDFNGDGRVDFVTANSSDNNVDELLGDGRGHFLSYPDYGTGLDPSFVATYDFNGDGVLDLVTADAGNGADSFVVSILLGNGDGTFQQNVDYQAGEEPYAIAIADFNGDGIADLAVADANCPYQPCPGGYISVLLGKGDGSFQAPMYFGSWGGAVYSIAAGDFNGDGKTDIAVADWYGSTVGVLLGNGDGTFQQQVEFPTGQAPASVIVRDFNGDGKLDIATANSCGSGPRCQPNNGTVSILLGKGDGTFQPHVDYAVGSYPVALATGDFRGNGITDIAVADCGGCTYPPLADAVSVLLGKGDGTFGHPTDYAAGMRPTSVAVMDINGDGRLDLAVGNVGSNTVSILIGKGNGAFQSHVDYESGNETSWVAAADFNGDGQPDLVSANVSPSTVSVLLNTAGTFVKLTSFPNPSRTGQDVTFTAKVAGSIKGEPVPTGKVEFKGGGSSHVVTLVNGMATFTTSHFSTGKHKVIAVYSGDSHFAPNKSAPIVQTVNP